jgi:Protein of unknown function (DUF1822)
MNAQNLSSFSVTLDLTMHNIAQGFYRHQSNSRKGKQVYLNTLAILTVNYYLNCLNIETNLGAGDSWDSVMQSLSDVADLEIKNSGRIECRPVLPDEDSCHVPPEVWSDRIGYVAVQFNRELTEAILLGFLPEVTSENVPIDRLQPLENLPEHIARSVPHKPVVLSRWLGGIFEFPWIPIDSLSLTRTAYNFMSDSPQIIRRGERLNLGMHFQNKEVALLIEMTPREELIEVQAKLSPVGEDRYLPAHIKLALLTQKDRVIQEVKARGSDFVIQLDKVSYRSGRGFRIQVSLEGDNITQDIDSLWSVTEDFVI